MNENDWKNDESYLDPAAFDGVPTSCPIPDPEQLRHCWSPGCKNEPLYVLEEWMPGYSQEYMKSAYCEFHVIAQFIATSEPEKFDPFSLPIHSYFERVVLTRIERTEA